MKKLEDFIKSNYQLILSAVFLAFLFFIIEDIFSNEIMKIDTLAYRLFVETLRNKYLTAFYKFITNFGDALAVVTITLLSFIFIKNRKVGLTISANLGIIFIFNQIFKFIIQRPRPVGYRLVEQSGYSFPSGHSMVSVAFYGYIIYLIYKSKMSKSKKITFISLLTLLILLIMSSRIYLGVHYASDVIAGCLLSIMYLFIFTKFSKKFIGEIDSHEQKQKHNK